MKIGVLIVAQVPEPLAAALACVRQQTHSERQVAIVDIGSDPHVPGIVNELAAAEPSLVYEQLRERRSLPLARNHLLEHTDAEAVAFLEDEGTWTPEHLANAAAALGKGADIVVSHVTFGSDYRSREVTVVPADLVSAPVRTLFARKAIPDISCVVARRSLLLAVNRFDSRFKGGGERDVWLRCAAKGARFAITGKPTCRCPRRPSGPAETRRICEDDVLFYEKHRELSGVPAAVRRRLLASALVAEGRRLQHEDPARAARCFWRAWSLQPMHVQTLGQFALTGWRAETLPPESSAT